MRKLVMLLMVICLALSGCQQGSGSPGATTPVTKEVKQVEREPFFKVQIETELQKAFSEGLDFSVMNYTQVDPMDNGLYTCQNTFVGKATKKTHSYKARIGYDKKARSATLYFMSIDGHTIMWDEEGEDAFMSK